MSESIKMIIANDEKKEDKAFFVNARDNSYDEIENETTKAFLSIIEGLGKERFDKIIKNYHLLESFIFSNLAKPKYEVNDFVVIKNDFLELVPNENLNVKISGVILDYSKCEILYFVDYHMNSSYAFKVIKENLILQKQEKDFTKDNYYGRDNLERFQYLQMERRTDVLLED